MKRKYLTYSIRNLKSQLSQLSRNTFKITAQFIKANLGIVKRDWSRLNKAEIIRLLNYYYNHIVGQVDLFKAALTRYNFRSVHSGDFHSVFPKLKPGSHWQSVRRERIQFSFSGVSLWDFKAQKMYSSHHQIDLWEVTDCFMVIAEIGEHLYCHVSQNQIDIPLLLNNVQAHYQELCYDC